MNVAGSFPFANRGRDASELSPNPSPKFSSSPRRLDALAGATSDAETENRTRLYCTPVAASPRSSNRLFDFEKPQDDKDADKSLSAGADFDILDWSVDGGAELDEWGDHRLCKSLESDLRSERKSSAGATRSFGGSSTDVRNAPPRSGDITAEAVKNKLLSAWTNVKNGKNVYCGVLVSRFLISKSP